MPQHNNPLSHEEALAKRDKELSDLSKAMKLIAKTNKGPEKQIASAGCSIKWIKN